MSEKISYLSEIVQALESLNGMGSLKEIIQIIEDNNKLPAIHTNPNWKDNVRATIQRHCSQTKSYRGGKVIFYAPYGLGEGFWSLQEYSYDTDEINPIIKRQIDSINKSNIGITEKEHLIKARVGQGYFRDLLIEKYGSCIITGINNPRLLVAGHIKPWYVSNNEERLSSENGLLLSPLYDKLFDIGLITFSDNMKIIVSKSVSIEDFNKFNISTDICYLRNPSDELLYNMEYHRVNIFKQ